MASIIGKVLPIPFLSNVGSLVAAIALIIRRGNGPKSHLTWARPLKIVVLAILISYFVWSILIGLFLAVALRGI